MSSRLSLCKDTAVISMLLEALSLQRLRERLSSRDWVPLKGVLGCLQEMKRVLFVFAKLNRGLDYVQGMNELLAPIYYQFWNDPEDGNREQAEADSFYCFMDIIAEFRDHFCQQLVPPPLSMLPSSSSRLE